MNQEVNNFTPKRSLMFTVDSILERIKTGEIKLTIRVDRGGKNPYGPPGTYAYIRETVQLVEVNPDSYVVEYVDGERRCIVGQPTKGMSLSRKTFARYMPKACARIIVAIQRVERRPVRSIRDDEVLAAGSASREDYYDLWDELNAERGYPIEDDPRGWFVFFEVVEVRK